MGFFLDRIVAVAYNKATFTKMKNCTEQPLQRLRQARERKPNYREILALAGPRTSPPFLPLPWSRLKPKTVDSREMEGPLDFEVEDYLTLHLNHLAQEEGYLRSEKLFVEMR